jgi:peptidyl-prolyl cis-trans isomerase SurA
MKIINKIICSIVISLICFAESEAIEDSIFATVGNKAVLKSDIVNEIKIILILNNTVFSEDLRAQLESSAIKAVIKKNIQKIEIEKYQNLRFNEDDLAQEINFLANDLNLELEAFKKIFVSNEISFSILEDKIKTELLWNSMIFDLYKNRLSVNIEEVDEQLVSLESKKEFKEYLISEMILENVAKELVETELEKIRNQIETDGFEKTAIENSISDTAVNGGDLGWISENVITDQFKTKILNTDMGQISEPIFMPEGIVIFKVRDKRTTKQFLDLDDAKNQLVNAEKQKMLTMHSLSHYDSIRRSVSVKYY